MYYYLFKTQCQICGAAYFGIHGNKDPFFADNPLPLMGVGKKLVQHYSVHPKQRHTTSLVDVFTSMDLAEKRLTAILTPDVLKDSRCLNIDPAETAEKMRQINFGVPKSDSHRAGIAVAVTGTQRALGGMQGSPEARAKAKKTQATIKWISRDDTGEEMQMPVSEIEECGMPTGFKLGRLKPEFRKNFVRSRKAPVPEVFKARLDDIKSLDR